MNSAIPAPIQTLLGLFTSSLADVRFADVDGQTFARCAADVDSAAEAVAAAQSALDAAREVLQQKNDLLLQRAQRALAYARVYAENDDALSAKLDAVTLPRAARRPRVEDVLAPSAEPQPPPRPRGRPKKVEKVEAAAPSAESASPTPL